ncbi:sensor histidine kinase [Actinomadura barringtoniae]|uniref:histidine kinase n=1 Tax=Actinomadura barringtoniae TaxID=1427535 RepID=A0A939PE58_9ACTN|nr:histidine kinase [Actinomadura barringtoniae]MBO2451182.1 sensor histidine kinase [Actinomadura barringtoniae]
MSETVSPPAGGWARLRAVLAWTGAVLYPVVLFATVQDGRSGFSPLAVLISALLTLLVLLLLRRSPWPAFGLLVFAWFAAAGLSNVQNGVVGSLQVLVTDFAVALVAMERSRRSSVIAAAVAVLVQAGCALVYAHGTALPQAIAFMILAGVVAWMAGNSVRVRRQHAVAMAARATEQAVTAERLRIARELHDMVAHSIGIIAIQAGVGSRVIDTQPDEARNALSAIEATSRDTLAGLRRMLGALRRAEPAAGGQGGGAEERAPLDPAPGLADLERLVDATMDAGVRVDVRRLGEGRALPAELDLSAFRIIQEAVTNVVRHAGAGRCQVTIDYRDDEIDIEIVDDGRGCEVGAAGGYGIIGMRERAGLLHGHFTAGPRAEGGFRVQARLPLPAAFRAAPARGGGPMTVRVEAR